jgi:hypothetical protein
MHLRFGSQNFWRGEETLEEIMEFPEENTFRKGSRLGFVLHLEISE